MTSEWQLAAAPHEVLLCVLPPESCGQELTLVKHCQSRLGTRENQSLASNIAKLGKAVKKDKERRGLSVSESSDNDDFDASKCLEVYGLSGIPHRHGLPHRELKALVKAAKRALKHKRKFIIAGSFIKHCPQWMSAKHRPTKFQDVTHAQWTANWWARALSQLTVQAATGKETVSVQTLVTQFLDANRLAIEDSGKTAFHYDNVLWEDMSEKCQRKDRDFSPSAVMVKVDQNSRKEAQAAVGLLATRQDKSQGIARANNTQFRGKGKPQHMSARPPPPPPPGPPTERPFQRKR